MEEIWDYIIFLQVTKLHQFYSDFEEARQERAKLHSDLIKKNWPQHLHGKIDISWPSKITNMVILIFPR